MKSNLKFFFVFFAFIASFPILAQQSVPSNLLLWSSKTNKSIKVANPYNMDKLQAAIGKAITVDKQVLEKEEAPTYVFTYDGLVIEMQNDRIKNLTITNKKWKLDGFTTGIFLGDIAAKYEEMKKIYAADYNFKVMDIKGCIFVDVDKVKTVKKLGIVFL